MKSGKHRMSLKLTEGEVKNTLLDDGAACLTQLFGLVRDGAAWDKDHGVRESTDAWYMSGEGSLYGNGKYDSDYAGEIYEGQIVSMEADLDKGTLRFWVDGKQHGPGYWLYIRSGVQGPVRWAVSLWDEGADIYIAGEV